MGNKTWPTVKYVEGESPWVTFARKQVHRKNNCINMIATGMPGSGKSWALLSYFSLVDPDFDVDSQCFFKALDLIKEFKNDRVLKGKPFMFDEAGIDANSLKWQNEINQGLNAFFQTARHRNYIFGMTVPFINFVSKGVRTLMNCHFIAEGWNSKNETKVKPRVLQYNGDMDKFYRKRLLIRLKGGVDFVNEIRLPKPRAKLVNQYEKKKKEFTTDLFGNIIEKIEENQEKRKKTSTLNLTFKQEQVLKKLKEGKRAIDIAREMGDIPQVIHGVIVGLRKKGVKVQKIIEAGVMKGYHVDDGIEQPN